MPSCGDTRAAQTKANRIDVPAGRINVVAP
jgi:hypothetical protein